MPASLLAKKCFLFDLDGTLVESAPLHESAFREVLNSVAPTLGFEYEYVRGLSTKDAFAKLGFRDQEQNAVLTRRKQNIYREALSSQGLRVIAGAIELLRALLERQRKVYLVSAASKRSSEATLLATGLCQYFDGVVTSDDVTKSKPDPESYQRCLEKYKLEPETCVVIEDSEPGLASGVSAGLDSVIVNCSGTFPQAVAVFSNLELLHRAILSD